jgi:hypothetical protein
MANILFNTSQNNINQFKKYYSLFIFICGSIQLVLCNNSIDIIVLLYVVLINILILLYCFQSNKFKLFPISYLIIFFSFFFNSASALFLKTFELSKVSSNLFLPNDIYLFLFISCIFVILVHSLYVRNSIKDKKSLMYNFNQKFKLFDIDLNTLFYLGIFSLFIQVLFTFDVVGFNSYSSNNSQFGRFTTFQDFMRGYNPFYILIFLLVLSKHIFNQNFYINKFLYLSFFLILIYISITTNRRDILFFGILTLLMILLTIFLLGKIIITKKTFFKYISIFIILFFSSETILKFNYAYIIERNNSSTQTVYGNLSSFFTTLKKLNNNPEFYRNFKSIKQFTVDYGLNINSYYNSLIYERFNPIKYADNILFFSHQLNQNSLDEVRSFSFKRIISIIPQPIISIFSKDFKKYNYIYETVATKIIKIAKPNHAASNDVGSILIDLKIFFGLLFIIPLGFLSYLSFIIFDSFYDRKKQIFSPIILIFIFYGSNSIYGLFSSTSLDAMITFILRGIPQSILLYLLFKIIFKYLFKSKTKFS